MGKFIWNQTGKLMRVSLNDIKNSKLTGGLNLPCIEKMASSLLLSQCLRAVRSNDQKTTRHIEYWLGDLIGSFMPNFKSGTAATVTPPYFEHIGLLMADLMAADFLNEKTICRINNRAIYAEFMTDLPSPKIVRESNRDYKTV